MRLASTKEKKIKTGDLVSFNCPFDLASSHLRRESQLKNSQSELTCLLRSGVVWIVHPWRRVHPTVDGIYHSLGRGYWVE